VDNSAFVISILALLFTVFSFYWMNWRRGKIEASAVKHWALFCNHSKLFVELPLVFFNSGPVPIVIESLRGKLINPEGETVSLHFNAIREKFGGEQISYSYPFAVHNKEAKSIICEFQRNPSDIVMRAGDYRFILECKTMNKRNWFDLKEFLLEIPEQKLESITKHYTVFESLI